eukprot:jgi/Botrbrau1/7570/Bobra.0159s0020.1
MDFQSALPAQHFPHDALRLGLRTLKDEASVVHPVQAVQENMVKHKDDSRVTMMRDIYGTGLAARYQIDKQILCRAGGLPGRVPTNLGWEALSGELDEFGPESYLCRPEEAVAQPPDFHSQMEAKLKMKTKPMTRGIF